MLVAYIFADYTRVRDDIQYTLEYYVRESCLQNLGMDITYLINSVYSLILGRNLDSKCRLKYIWRCRKYL